MGFKLLGPDFKRDIIRMGEDIVIPIGIGGCTTFGGNDDVGVAFFEVLQWGETWLVALCAQCVKQEEIYAWGEISNLASIRVKLLNDGGYWPCGETLATRTGSVAPHCVLSEYWHLSTQQARQPPLNSGCARPHSQHGVRADDRWV